MHGYGKNLVVLYGQVKKFDCGKILGRALIFMWRDIGFFGL